MASEWRVYTVDQIKADVPNAIAIGPFGSRMKADLYVEDGVPVIRGSNLGQGKYFVGEFVYVSDQTADDLKSCNVLPNDLVFPHRGAIGEVGIILPDGFPRYMLSTSLMKLTCDPRIANPLFVYYFFKSQHGRHELLKHASTVGTPGIGQPLTSLRQIEIKLPSLEEQEAIVSVLSSVDDAIETARSQNLTLEAMAQAIFKSWFVHFDPVKAKAEGREPEGMDAATAALFPSEFEDSELGPIPRGWKIDSILAIAKLLSGGTPKTDRKDYWSGSIQWASAKDVSQCPDSFLVQTERTITEKGLNESAARMIPALSTAVVARGATTGRIAIFGKPMAMNQTCYALASSTGTPYYLYCAFCHEVQSLLQAAHGSVFETITTSTFASDRSVIPPDNLLAACEDTIRPLFSRMLSNTEQAITVSELRDTLLPKLMSGQLRLPEAEAIVSV